MAISETVPVIYYDRSVTGESPVTLKEFIRKNSNITHRVSLCYKNRYYSLSEATLKMDLCFFKKNISLLNQVLPEVCIQSIIFFNNKFEKLSGLPLTGNKFCIKFSKLDQFDLLLCYSLIPMRLFRKVVDFFCYWEQWHIGIVEDDIEKIVSSGFSIDKIMWLPGVKKNQFIADPFGIKLKNKLYIFAELWDSANPVGKIVWSDESTSFSEWNTFLDYETHLSYPFLFRKSNRVYCMPESAENGNFKLYTAGIFPEKWNNGELLFRDFRMADASLLFWAKKYWLFAAKANGDSAYELFIWFSDKINGEWKAHPMNPVKRDIISARPAGPPFTYKNTIYRPAQDCSDSYGRRIIMNRVTLLSETDFMEEHAGIIKGPDNSPYPDGMHTFSVIDGVIVIDGKRKVFSLFNYRILSYKFKRILQFFLHLF